MAVPKHTIRVHQSENSAIFGVIGQGTMHQSLPFRRMAECCLSNGVKRLCVDLRDCTHLDSTFLGTLLALRARAENSAANLILQSPSQACSRILLQAGLSEHFTQEEAPECPGPWIELPAGTDDVAGLKRNVIEAHQELAALPGPAGEQFRAVIRCLTQAGEISAKISPQESSNPSKSET